MKHHGYKMLAPIIIAVFLVLYFGGFVLACIFMPVPVWGKILGAVIPLALGGVAIYVLVERIKEIRSGEEDDLSNY